MIDVVPEPILLCDLMNKKVLMGNIELDKLMSKFNNNNNNVHNSQELYWEDLNVDEIYKNILVDSRFISEKKISDLSEINK